MAFTADQQDPNVNINKGDTGVIKSINYAGGFVVYWVTMDKDCRLYPAFQTFDVIEIEAVRPDPVFGHDIPPDLGIPQRKP